MHSAEFWIDSLKLNAHPEGGYYQETYRSAETIELRGLTGIRSVSTAIYFLLRSSDRSFFHRIQSDELWHFYDGSSVSIYILNEEGLTRKKLGRNPDKGELFQVVVPARCWFGALVEETDAYTLAGCTVAPGFDFRDFELADRETLLKDFPYFHEIIVKLTK